MRLLEKIRKVEEFAIGFVLIFLAIVTFCETALRYTVSVTFMWFNEFANYTLIFMTFLGASLGARYGTHFSMEALPESLSGRKSHLIKSIAYFLSFLVCIIFVIYGILHIIHLGKFNVKSSALEIPMYIPYLPIPFFSATMGLRFMILSLNHLRSFLKNEPYVRITKT